MVSPGNHQRVPIQSCFVELKVKPAMIQSTVTEERSSVFVERRQRDASEVKSTPERRQFRDGDRSARPEVAEFANAVDDYKIAHHRRFITFEELYDVMASLGYHR